MAPESGETGIAGFLRELRRSLLLDAAKKGTWWVLGLIAAALALLVVEGGSIPVWTLPVTVVVLAGMGAWWLRRRTRGLTSRIDGLAEERDSIAGDADAMALGLERHESYSGHVAQALTTRCSAWSAARSACRSTATSSRRCSSRRGTC